MKSETIVKCRCCENQYPKGTSGIIDEDKMFTCYTCFGDVVAQLTPEDFDKMNEEEYNAFSWETLNKECPEPTRQTIFYKIMQGNRIKEYLNKKGVDINWSEDKERISLHKIK